MELQLEDVDVDVFQGFASVQRVPMLRVTSNGPTIGWTEVEGMMDLGQPNNKREEVQVYGL